MILCEFHMPWADNDKRPLSQIHTKYRRVICNEFGGVTTYDAKGDWIDPSSGDLAAEMVTVYRVAVQQVSEVKALQKIALDFAADMKQKALFFAVIGKAEIIEVK